MNQFRNVLYFADGKLDKNPALDRAVALVVSNNAQLTVIDVISPPLESDTLRKRFPIEAHEELKQHHTLKLKELVSHQAQLETQVSVVVIVGVGFIEVIRQVLSADHDLVIKPAQNDCQSRLSSADMHLLRKCPCPVWIDRSLTNEPYKMVLAALDPMSEHGDDCADQALELALNVSNSDQSCLALLHAWQLYGESMLSSGLLRVSDTELRMLLEEARCEHEKALVQLLERHHISPAQVAIHVEKGEPAEVIQAVTQRLRADLIVMGTVGRTGVPGFIIGNTAEEVLQSCCCSVLAVKPSAFVSPVKPISNS